MLVLSRKQQEAVVIGGSGGLKHLVKVTVVDIEGPKVKLGFEVDSDIPVHRLEVWERIQAGNRLASSNAPNTAIENRRMSTQPTNRGQSPDAARTALVALLNEDLAGEYQAIISYVVYSQMIKGAPYMTIAAEFKKHAAEELQHALIIAGQIDYLGGVPMVVAKAVKPSATAEDMLRFELENENETIRRYRDRVGQCEALGEYAVAQRIRKILLEEQDHRVAVATALGIDVPDVTGPAPVKARKPTAKIGASGNGTVAKPS